MTTHDDLARIDRMLSGQPDLPPERIFNWMDTQMSIARFYGGICYCGHQYFIAPAEKGQPLVRGDVLARERKEAARQLIGRRRADKEAAKAAQGDLL